MDTSAGDSVVYATVGLGVIGTIVGDMFKGLSVGSRVTDSRV